VLTLPFLWLWFTMGGSPRLAQRLRHVALVVVACFAVIAPWSARNLVVFGDFVPITVNGGYTFLGSNNPNAFGGHAEDFPDPIPGLTPPQEEKAYYKLGLDWIEQHPDAWARLIPVKLSRLWSPLAVGSSPKPFPVPGAALIYAAYAAYLGIALLGLAISWPLKHELSLLLVAILPICLSAIVFYGDTRFSLPMVPALIIFFVTGAACVCRRIQHSSKQPELPAAEA
jgi:hypothetical protein